MKHSALVLAACAPLLLGACSLSQTPSDDGSGGSGASSEAVTRNVTYEGVISELGVSIYMQGTHKLTLEDGRFVILESSTLDLNNYMDRAVRVTGDERATVEEGGLILRVTSVTTLQGRSSSSSSQTSTGSSLSSSGSSVSSVMQSSNSSVSSSRSSAVSSGRSSAAVSSVASAASSVSSVTDANAAKVQAMAKANMSAANWSQKYCSNQIGFCVPVHKNWWFTSFGATSSFLAHVEVGPEELQNLGDGPLAINVVAGSIGTAGVTDGLVTSQGSDTVGYRAWSNDRHIEIRGPSALAEAIRYMTQNLGASAQ